MLALPNIHQKLHHGLPRLTDANHKAVSNYRISLQILRRAQAHIAKRQKQSTFRNRSPPRREPSPNTEVTRDGHRLRNADPPAPVSCHVPPLTIACNWSFSLLLFIVLLRCLVVFLNRPKPEACLSGRS